MLFFQLQKGQYFKFSNGRAVYQVINVSSFGTVTYASTSTGEVYRLGLNSKSKGWGSRVIPIRYN